MIRKPGSDWGRESAAVTAVRSVATTGKTAVKVGTRAASGVASCLFGALWMFGALGSLFSGSIPGLIGCGAVGLFFIVRGGRAFAPQAAPADPPVAQAAAAGTVEYARNKLVLSCLFYAAFIGVALMGVRLRGTYLQLIALVLAPLFAVMLVSAVRKLFGDATALRWDGQELTVASLIGARTAAWSSVSSIKIEQVNSYYGVFRVGTRRTLAFGFTDGPLHKRRLALPANLLDLEGRTLEGLALTLQAAQLGRGARAPERSPAPAAAPDYQPSASLGFARARTHQPEPFDADAAIARYVEAEAPRPVERPAPRPVPPPLAAPPPRYVEAEAPGPARRPAPRPVPPPVAAPAPTPAPAPPMSFGTYGAMPARTTFGLRGA